jgi:hypothetical protein
LLVATCPAGLGDCDGLGANGCETALATTVEHCGRCGNACVAGVGEDPLCLSGECVGMCPSGFDDCDGDPANGCEQALDTDEHCGGCNVACDPLNATGTCSSGSCRISMCDAGFDDCDMMASTGCEVRLATDRMNCGVCGRRCMGGGQRDCCDGNCC